VTGGFADMAAANALPLTLALLLLGAVFAAAIPHARVSWLAASLAAIGAAVFAVRAGMSALAGQAPNATESFGVTLMLDGVGAFAAPIIVCAAALVLIAAAGRPGEGRAAPFAIALAACSTAGWCGALFARDLIGFVVAVEAAWLASVALIAVSSDRGALNGALRMLVAGGVGATLMIVGVSLVARAAGSVDPGALPHTQAVAMPAVGVALMLVSLAMRAGLAPLHAWAGPALGRADAFPASLVGVVGLLGALAAIVRLAHFSEAAPGIAAGVSAALATIGAASVAIGSVQAVGATSLRRMAGYALASQAGCVLLSVSLGSPAGFAAALVQLFALGAAALALFIGAAVVREPGLNALDGLGRRAPLAGIAITAGALSLMGAPLTIGFLGRWRLIEAAVGAGWWWMAGVTLLASLAAVFYGGRLIERVYFRRDTTVRVAERDPWRLALTPALVVAIAGIGLGFEPSVLLRAASSAAALLFGYAP
jgi:multicomponent Na+:H+ antiporter subunit D